MERFGYLVRLNARNELKFVSNVLFKDIVQCVRSAMQHEVKEDIETLCYFKILNNVQIVKLVSKISEECIYGYVYLLQYQSSDHSVVPYGWTMTLYSHLLDCILDAKKSIIFDLDNVCNPENKIKIGYFHVLESCQFLQELHL